MQCGECEDREDRGVLSGGYEVGIAECEVSNRVWSAKCRVWREKCEVQSAECKV